MFDSTSILKSVLLVLLCGGVHQAYTTDTCAEGSRQPLASEVPLPFKDAVGDSCPEEPQQNSIAAEYQSERIKASFPIKERHSRSEETVYGEVYDPYTDKEPLPDPQPKSPEQLESLRQKIQTTRFLSQMDEKRLTAALSHMTLKEVKAGDVIFKQGDRGDVFYVIEEGEFDAYHKEHESEKGLGEKTGTYGADRPYIDEYALLWSDELLITVKARTDGKLWQIHRWLYTRIVVKMSYERRQRHMAYLSAVPMLETLEEYEKVRLCDVIDLQKFSKGDVMMKEGDKADGVFFIDEGEAELKTRSGVTKILKKGDHFGELALLTRQPRDANCTASTDLEAAFLDAEGFERMIGKLQVLLRRKPGFFEKVCKDALGTENPDKISIR